MPSGIQVWGPDGSLWVNITSRLGRFYGSTTLGPGNDTQLLPVLAGQGIPFCYAPFPEIDTRSFAGVTYRAPTVSHLSFDGTEIESLFVFASYANPYIFVYYGAY